MENQTVITSTQGATDALKAFGRYLYVIFSVGTGLFAVLGTGDAEAMFTYFQDNVGQVVAAVVGISGIATAAYGIYRSYRRGQKLVEVEQYVPNTLLTMKG